MAAIYVITCCCLISISYGHIVNYSGSSLTSVPDNIPNDTMELQLQHNLLSSIRYDAFHNLTNLKRLYLHHNNLVSLVEGLFAPLVSLEKLDLQVTKLTTLQDSVFTRLTNLVYLFLNHNQLTTLPLGIFTDLHSLQVLHLHHNNITTVPSRVFAGTMSLHTLTLYDNQLTTLCGEDLVALKKLSIWLQNNPLELCNCRNAMLRYAELHGATIHVDTPPSCWTYANILDTSVCPDSTCEGEQKWYYLDYHCFL